MGPVHFIRSGSAFVSHGHDDIQEAIITFDRNGADDVIDLEKDLFNGQVFEGIQQEVGVERGRHFIAFVCNIDRFAAFPNGAVCFKEKFIGIESQLDIGGRSLRKGHTEDLDCINEGISRQFDRRLEGGGDDLAVIGICTFDQFGNDHGFIDTECDLFFADFHHHIAFASDQALQFVSGLQSNDNIAIFSGGCFFQRAFAKSKAFAVGGNCSDLTVPDGKQDTGQNLAGIIQAGSIRDPFSCGCYRTRSG